jgi:hypothetical protein
MTGCRYGKCTRTSSKLLEVEKRTEIHKNL